jgi:hypothetical protein
MEPQVAVLTGDLIGSTEASHEEVEAAVKRIADVARRIDPGTRFTRYRGDGWQIYLEEAGEGLGAMVLIATELRAAAELETRIALGLGTVVSQTLLEVLSGSLSSATGPAFIASGRALDAMPAGQRMALAGEGTDILHHRLVAMIDERVSGWSREQSEAVALALAPEGPPKQAEMATKLGISRQAVAARLQTAGFTQIDLAAADFLRHFGKRFATND